MMGRRLRCRACGDCGPVHVLLLVGDQCSCVVCTLTCVGGGTPSSRGERRQQARCDHAVYHGQHKTNMVMGATGTGGEAAAGAGCCKPRAYKTTQTVLRPPRPSSASTLLAVAAQPLSISRSCCVFSCTCMLCRPAGTLCARLLVAAAVAQTRSAAGPRFAPALVGSASGLWAACDQEAWGQQQQAAALAGLRAGAKQLRSVHDKMVSVCVTVWLLASPPAACMQMLRTRHVWPAMGMICN